ncbi:nucleotidyltransferase family protein [Verrucomicrobiota bacterium]
MAAFKPNIDEAVLLASFPPADIPEAALDITGGFGWKEFLAAAHREGLAQLVYYNHRQPIKQGRIPPHAAAHLEKAYFAVLARNTVVLQKLAELSAALAGIDLIPLKGAFLASDVYASPGLRPFSDIDILVRRTHFPTADERLTQLGYEPIATVEDRSVIPAESAFLNSVMYRDKGTGPALHVHWHLLNTTLPRYLNTTLDMNEIWKAAKPSTDAALELCPEHLLIHLSEHALRHSFDRLILLRDIAEVIMKLGPEIDWERLVHDSVRFNLNYAVYYSMVFASRGTGVHVPDSAITALHSDGPGWCGRLFMKLTTSGRRSPELCNLAYLDNITSFRDKAAYVRQMLFPPRHVLAHAYGKERCEIGPAFYALRLLRGLRRVLRPFKRKP